MFLQRWKTLKAIKICLILFLAFLSVSVTAEEDFELEIVTTNEALEAGETLKVDIKASSTDDVEKEVNLTAEPFEGVSESLPENSTTFNLTEQESEVKTVHLDTDSSESGVYELSAYTGETEANRLTVLDDSNVDFKISSLSYSEEKQSFDLKVENSGEDEGYRVVRAAEDGDILDREVLDIGSSEEKEAGLKPDYQDIQDLELRISEQSEDISIERNSPAEENYLNGSDVTFEFDTGFEEETTHNLSLENGEKTLLLEDEKIDRGEIYEVVDQLNSTGDYSWRVEAERNGYKEFFEGSFEVKERGFELRQLEEDEELNYTESRDLSFNFTARTEDEDVELKIFNGSDVFSKSFNQVQDIENLSFSTEEEGLEIDPGDYSWNVSSEGEDNLNSEERSFTVKKPVLELDNLSPEDGEIKSYTNKVNLSADLDIETDTDINVTLEDEGGEIASLDDKYASYQDSVNLTVDELDPGDYSWNITAENDYESVEQKNMEFEILEEADPSVSIDSPEDGEEVEEGEDIDFELSAQTDARGDIIFSADQNEFFRDSIDDDGIQDFEESESFDEGDYNFNVSLETVAGELILIDDTISFGVEEPEDDSDESDEGSDSEEDDGYFDYDYEEEEEDEELALELESVTSSMDEATVGEEVRLAGTVVDEEGEAVEDVDVEVSLVENEIETLTDEDGNFEVFLEVPDYEGQRSFTLELEKDGYEGDMNLSAEEIDIVRSTGLRLSAADGEPTEVNTSSRSTAVFTLENTGDADITETMVEEKTLDESLYDLTFSDDFETMESEDAVTVTLTTLLPSDYCEENSCDEEIELEATGTSNGDQLEETVTIDINQRESNSTEEEQQAEGFLPDTGSLGSFSTEIDLDIEAEEDSEILAVVALAFVGLLAVVAYSKTGSDNRRRMMDRPNSPVSAQRKLVERPDLVSDSENSVGFEGSGNEGKEDIEEQEDEVFDQSETEDVSGKQKLVELVRSLGSGGQPDKV